MTGKELADNYNVNIDKNSTPTEIISMLSKIPLAVLSGIPGIAAALTALKAANSAYSTTRGTYEQASQTLKSAKKGFRYL